MPTREQINDIFIIGGGINGAGIARDAAGRGLSVSLCEQNDFSSGTSWASTKLIHGGLRYLENFEFKLVREALAEREVLMRIAPHIVQPLRFILPHSKKMRPAWLIKLGLFLYDHLAKNKSLPNSQVIKTKQLATASILKPEFGKAFLYSDCQTDDTRLVILNLLAAREHGANILARHQCTNATREDKHWRIVLKHNNTEKVCYARCLINAAGPWAEQVLTETLTVDKPVKLSLIKGSHIVVNKLYDGDEAFILQHDDKRVIFIIPFHQHYSLIGTTDVAYQSDPKDVSISPEEIDYLCSICNQYFQKELSADDIVWHYSGVRPLQFDENQKAAKISREYDLVLNSADGQAPLLSVIGGKLTGYRLLAETSLAKLTPFFPQMRPCWTADSTLPGGDIADLAQFSQSLQQAYPFLPQSLVKRYASSYGTLSYKLLGESANIADLGECFGTELYAREVEYLQAHEWAQSAEDIIWHRTKLGINLDADALAKLKQFMQPQ